MLGVQWETFGTRGIPRPPRGDRSTTASSWHTYYARHCRRGLVTRVVARGGVVADAARGPDAAHAGT